MLPCKRLFAHMQGMMAGRKLATALFLSMCFVTASYQIDENSVLLGEETILTPQFVEEMVKRSSLEVVGTLKEAMRRGFEDLKWELKIERTRRQGLEEKMEKCMCGSATTMANTTRSPSTTTMAPTVPPCSEGFIGYEGHCYRFEMNKMTWRNAKRECVRKGAHLVYVNSQLEQDFLVTQIRNNREYRTSDRADSYWLGMEYSNGNKRWGDGTVVNYTWWGDNQPNCVKNGCKVIIQEFLGYDWEDVNAYYDYFSICEMEA